MAGNLIFFWDYDTQWGADRSRSPGGPKTWGHSEFENTERLLELHDQYNIPACFAVVGAAALEGGRPYHDPQQIRRIHEMGHEIASHSMYHEWLPGLGYSKLLQTLRGSKDALEQCIDSTVSSFVPPYNQPFDYPRKGSISISERIAVRKDRIGIMQLCQALNETGYLFSRISYQTLGERIYQMLLGDKPYPTSNLEKINGIICVRLNTGGGFRDKTMGLIARIANSRGMAVVYGHPHSLYSSTAQNERYLIPLMALIEDLVTQGRLKVVLPRELVSTGS